jgi:hypothetical protein
VALQQAIDQARLAYIGTPGERDLRKRAGRILVGPTYRAGELD